MICAKPGIEDVEIIHEPTSSTLIVDTPEDEPVDEPPSSDPASSPRPDRHHPSDQEHASR